MKYQVTIINDSFMREGIMPGKAKTLTGYAPDPYTALDDAMCTMFGNEIKFSENIALRGERVTAYMVYAECLGVKGKLFATVNNITPKKGKANAAK